MNRFYILVTGLVSFAYFSTTGGALAKTFVVSHIIEKSGTINNSAYTFDSTIVLTYNGSLNGNDTKSATVDIYLYDEDTGQLMRGVTGTVCGPCTYALGAKQRKVTIQLDDLITNNGGGFDRTIKFGFAVVVVNGDGADAVTVQGFVVNSHTSAFDLSVFGFEPQPISAASVRRTLVIPHVLESSGRATTTSTSDGTSNAFDTTIYMTYTGGLPGSGGGGGGASVDLYLYDQGGGQPMIGGSGTAVCNPCTFALGTNSPSAPRKRTVVVDDLITAAGGFGGAVGKQGFGVLVVGGADPAGVNLQSFIVNSHTGPFDLSVFSSEPHQVKTNASSSGTRAFVLPHVLEKSGLTTSQQYTFDTTLFATYVGGIGDVAQGQGATLALYLYDDSGALMHGSNGLAICNPCTYALDTATRKQSIRIDDLITTSGGGFDTTNTKTGFAVMVVGGDQPDAVSLQGFVVNSHTGPFDVSVFGFDPQPLDPATAFDLGTKPGLAPRAFIIPHVLETSGTINDTPSTFDSTFHMTYTGGLPGTGTVSSNGATASLYLYDAVTGQPLSGSSATVCNPCMFDLTSSARKLSVTIDDLITSRGGGFDTSTKQGFGIVVLGGNDPENVRLEGFVVNAHTGPFDLSVFGFEPQPLDASRTLPMTIQAGHTGSTLQISVPTVIGRHYSIEGKLDLGDLLTPWEPVTSFDGDGSVKSSTIDIVPPRKYLHAVGM